MSKIELKHFQKLMTLSSIGIVLVGIFLILQISPSKAQSNTCQSLKAQLASLSSNRSSSGKSAKYRRYDAAVREQTVQLNKTIKIGRRKGCIGLGILSLRSAHCKRIKSSIESMQRNLTKLKSQRAKSSPQQLGNSNKRQKILRSLRANNCDKRQAATFNSQSASNSQNKKPARKKRRLTLLEKIFGVRAYKENGSRSNQYDEDFDGPVQNFRGTFRTLCVRKSDGYYFPISFSTTEPFFERDDERCRDMCPSQDVGLYMHRMPSEDSEDMVSYETQKPYAGEDFAFLYRKKFDREKSCRFSQPELANLERVTVKGKSKRPKPKKRNIGIPSKKLDRHLSPDEIESAIAHVDMSTATQYLLKKQQKDASGPIVAGTVEPSNNKKIRIVGGVFFPVQ